MVAFAPALAIPFAEAVGITITGLSLAAITDKVSQYVNQNPEESKAILKMILPASVTEQGLSTLFKKKAKSPEKEVDSEDIDPQDLSREDKAKIMKEYGKSRGQNKRERMIEIAKQLGLVGEEKEKQKVFDEVEQRYENDEVEENIKPKFDYKRFFKADGGRVGYAKGGRGYSDYASPSSTTASQDFATQAVSGGQTDYDGGGGGNNQPITEIRPNFNYNIDRSLIDPRFNFKNIASIIYLQEFLDKKARGEDADLEADINFRDQLGNLDIFGNLGRSGNIVGANIPFLQSGLASLAYSPDTGLAAGLRGNLTEDLSGGVSFQDGQQNVNFNYNKGPFSADFTSGPEENNIQVGFKMPFADGGRIGFANGGENIIGKSLDNITNVAKGLDKEMLDMTFDDKYYRDVIQPAKLGQAPIPGRMEMMLKSKPFTAVGIGMRPGTFGERAQPTKAASQFLNTLGKGAKFVGTKVGPLSFMDIFASTPLGADDEVTDEMRQSIEMSPTSTTGIMVDANDGFRTSPATYYNSAPNFNADVLREEEDAQYNLPQKNMLQNLKDYLPFIGDKSITGMLTRGIGQFFNNIGDRIPSTPQYQQYTPGYNYGNLNPNLIDDFYDPATGLNRFDRAKTLFGQSRTLSEFLSKRRERAAAEADLVQRREIERKLEREKTLARNTSSNIDYGGFVSGGGTHSSDSSFTGHSSATGGGMGQSGWGGPRAKGGFIGDYEKGGRVGYVGGGLATTQDFANALKSVSAGTTYQQQAQAKEYARNEAANELRAAIQGGGIDSFLGGAGLSNYRSMFPNDRAGTNRQGDFTGTYNARKEQLLDALMNKKLQFTSYAPPPPPTDSLTGMLESQMLPNMADGSMKSLAEQNAIRDRVLAAQKAQEESYYLTDPISGKKYTSQDEAINDLGLVTYNQRFADGGRISYQAGGVATPEQYAAALQKVGAGTETQKRTSLGNYLGDYIATQGQKLGNAAVIPFQAAKGVLGIQGTPITDSMQTSLQNIIQNQIKNSGKLSGNINYNDYGVKTNTQGNEFLGFGDRSFTDPEAALATTLGQASYSVDPKTGKITFTGGTAYDFGDDQFGGLGKFISKGGVFNQLPSVSNKFQPGATEYNPDITLGSDFMKQFNQPKYPDYKTAALQSQYYKNNPSNLDSDLFRAAYARALPDSGIKTRITNEGQVATDYGNYDPSRVYSAYMGNTGTSSSNPFFDQFKGSQYADMPTIMEAMYGTPGNINPYYADGGLATMFRKKQ
jgi:hypothetical protein